MRRGRFRIFLALVAGVVTPACSFDKAAMLVCQTDQQCASGEACMSGACLPIAAPQGVWGIEIVPPNDSPAAVTDIGSIQLDGSLPILKADQKAMISGTLPQGSVFAGVSHVIATVAPVIPGRPDAQFEGQWIDDGANGGTPQFSMTVPQGVVGESAVLHLLPLPPRDRAQPPITTKVTLVDGLDVTVDNDFLFVTGRLVSALQRPIGGFTARAFQGSQLVSNVLPLASDGIFMLSIPPDTTSAAAKRLITVQFDPTDPNGPNPRFTTLSVSLGTDTVSLGDVALPPFGNPSYFRFVVQNQDPGKQPVSGATVTLRTVISSDNVGQADYTRSGVTDASGRVDLPLLPGTQDQARPYDISVTPPTGSAFGVSCLTKFPITAGTTGTSGPPVAAWLDLPARVPIAGTILSAAGTPVEGVSIVATQTAADPSEFCANVSTAPPATGNSDKNGNFNLLVDPGTYQIDYDPPAGSPVPRLTETSVVVTSDGAPSHVVQMLPGALVRGTVVGPDGATGLPSAGVRLFEIVCSGDSDCFGPTRVAPILGAQTHTDANGAFSAVVPMQARGP